MIVPPVVDASAVVACSRANCSHVPVVTARYTIDVVMNESEYGISDEAHRDAMGKEFQRALDAGFFTDIRYDALQFDVVKREVLDEAPANYPENSN